MYKRQAYGYQYLADEEEKAIPYAMRWAELDPEDENALGVVKECKEEVEKRKQSVNAATERVITQETAEIDEDWGIYLCRAFACDLPAVIRLNLALMDFESTSNYPKRLRLQILYKNADDNGFPTREEGEYLYQVEDAVLEIIEKHGDILAGVVKCDERVHIYAYAKNESGYADEISEMISEDVYKRQLDDKSETIECKHDFSLTNEFLKAKNIESEKVIEFLEENGAGCDCEVIFNVEEKFEE